MAKFKIVLDKRVPLKNEKYNLAVRMAHKKQVMFLNLEKLTQHQYDIVFVKNSMDEKSVEFRKKCNEYINKCERIFFDMDVFDRTLFRKHFYNTDEDEGSPDGYLIVNDLFKKYVASCGNKQTTNDHYLMVGRIIETFHPGATVEDITVDFLKKFEKYILNNGGNSPATVDSYMRNLRRIIRCYLFEQPIISKNYTYPFSRGKYIIGSYWPKKQVLTQEEIQKVLQFKNFDKRNLEYARDIWALLFYMNGMNIGDLLWMKKSEIDGKYINYLRRKTLTTRRNNVTPITIPITPEIKHYIEKVKAQNSDYLLGKVKEDYSDITYKNKIRKVRKSINERLSVISDQLELSVPLKLKTARDCYASFLRAKGVLKDDISSMLGHSNSIVTEHYLASIDLQRTFDINSVLPKLDQDN